MLHVVRFQLLYLMRPHCRVKDRLLDGIAKNLGLAGIDPDGELWMEIVARVIKACGVSLNRRVELLIPCLDAIEFLIENAKSIDKKF